MLFSQLLPWWELRVRMNVRGVHLCAAYARGKPLVVGSDLAYWRGTTAAASWLSAQDVTATFPNAVRVSGNDWEFPMPRCTAVVEALVQFRTGLVLVTKVRET